MIKFLFSFRGRFGRLGMVGWLLIWPFLMAGAFLAIASIEFTGAFDEEFKTRLIEQFWSTHYPIFVAFYIAFTLSFLTVAARRMHDIGISAWWSVPGYLLYTALSATELLSHLMDKSTLPDISPVKFNGYSFMEAFEDRNTVMLGLYALLLIYLLLTFLWRGKRGNNKFVVYYR